MCYTIAPKKEALLLASSPLTLDPTRFGLPPLSRPTHLVSLSSISLLPTLETNHTIHRQHRTPPLPWTSINGTTLEKNQSSPLWYLSAVSAFDLHSSELRDSWQLVASHHEQPPSPLLQTFLFLIREQPPSCETPSSLFLTREHRYCSLPDPCFSLASTVAVACRSTISRRPSALPEGYSPFRSVISVRSLPRFLRVLNFRDLHCFLLLLIIDIEQKEIVLLVPKQACLFDWSVGSAYHWFTTAILWFLFCTSMFRVTGPLVYVHYNIHNILVHWWMLLIFVLNTPNSLVQPEHSPLIIFHPPPFSLNSK